MSILHKTTVSFWQWMTSVKFLAVYLLLIFSISLYSQCVPTLAFTSTETSGGQSDFGGRLGLRFTNSSSIRVTQLGVFDDNTVEGITGNITVGIVNAGGTTVAGPITISGSGDPLVGRFRMRDISPVVLPAGTYYIVASGFGATDPNGNINNTDTPVIFNGGSLLSFVSSVYDLNPAFVGVPSTLDLIGGNYHAGTFTFSDNIPVLKTTINSAQITTNNNSVNDTVRISICDLMPNNLKIDSFIITSGGNPQVKIRQVVTGSGATVGWGLGTALPIAFAGAMSTASLSNPVLAGTVSLKFFAFTDTNNDNNPDPNECKGDTIVYLVTVNPKPTVSLTIGGIALSSINNGVGDPGETATINLCNGGMYTVANLVHSNAASRYLVAVTPIGGGLLFDGNPAGGGDITSTQFNGAVGPHTVTLVNPTIAGSLKQVITPYNDVNGSNSFDAGDCKGDSIIINYVVAAMPVLKTTINSGQITTDNNSVNDTVRISVCNLMTNNLKIDSFIITSGADPQVKIRQIITGSGANVSPWVASGTAGPGAFANQMATASLTNPALAGTVSLKFFAFTDTNNDNNADLNECKGDTIVYLVTVNPKPIFGFTATVTDGLPQSASNNAGNATINLNFCAGQSFAFTNYISTLGSQVRFLERIVSGSGNVTYNNVLVTPIPRPQSELGASFFTGPYGPYGLSSGTTGSLTQILVPYYDSNNSNSFDSGDCLGDTITLVYFINVKPNAGRDTTACLKGRAFMTGSGTGTWTAQTGNPGTATIVAPTSPTTAITGFSNQGTYNFIFTNPMGCSDTARVTVSNTVITCWPDTTVNILTPGRCDTMINLRPPVFLACKDSMMRGPYINGVLMAGVTSATFTAGKTHTVAYSFYDATGFRLDSCVRRYIIRDFFNNSLACQQIQASLGGDCKDTVTVREVLVGWDQPGMLPDLLGCDTLYKINVKNSIGQNLGPILSSNEIDKILTYTVTHPSGFSCSSTVEVKDKIKPTVVCRTDSIKVSCLANIDTVAAPIAVDNCPGARVIMVDRVRIPLPCDPIYVGKVLRTWVAEDARGLRSDANCTDTIYLRRSTFSGITPVTNDTLRCNEVYQRDGKGNNYPHPNVTGIPKLGNKNLWPQSQLDMEYCSALIDYEDRLILQSACKTRIQRIWTITEWWCNTSVIFPIGMQFIDIIDDIKPSIPQLDTIIISTESRSCKGRLVLDRINITDNCSSIDRVIINAVRITGAVPTGFIDGNGGTMTLDTGWHLVTYKAFDICGNDSTMSFRVLVKDETDPVALCDELATVSLKANGYTEITAAAVNDGSYDECGPVTVQIRRMEDPCRFGANTAWFDKVGFCCLDGDRTRMVQLQVTDASGNTNICMVSVRIQNKVTPALSCPAPQSKPCDFTFDPSNLKDYFGPAIITGSECLNLAVPTDVVETNNRNQCGIGHIIRRISLPDNGQTCTQRIDFTPITPFNGPYFWPRDTTIVGQCSPLGLDTAALGAPRFTEGFCSMVGLRYDDQVFPFTTNGACFKIIRTWKVIDWCQTSTSTPPVATWTWDQEIKVMDTIAPIMNLPVNLTFGSANCTSSNVEIIATATDCTPQADLVWNYSIRRGSNVIKTGTGNTIRDSFVLGDYKVIWRVEDRCGNIDIDSMNFRVVTTKTASAICKNGLAASLTHMDTNGDAIPDTYMTRLTPVFFNNKSVHACDSLMVLKLSFSSSVNDTVRNYICDSVGRKTVRMYVTDIYGNQSFCQTFVDIQATPAQCPGISPLIATVSGRAAKENNETIEDVIVELKGSEIPSLKTGKDGLFNFGAMPVGGKYQIVPGKDGDDMNGVTTLDAVIIQRHILGIEPLKSPYQMIAADANRSGSITASDLTEMRKLLLGINTSFQNNASWRFVDGGYKFPNPTNPWQSSIPENYSIDILNSNMDINFIGIKVGDVNGNAKGSNFNGEIESRSSFTIQMDDMAVKKGQKLSIPVRISESALLHGVQTKFLSNSIRVDRVEDAGQIWNYSDGVKGDPTNIRFNAVAAHGLKIETSDVLMMLHGEALQDGLLSHMLTLDPKFVSEVYTDGLESKKLTIQWRDKGNLEFVLSGVVPNPWNNHTSISFQLPAAGKVSMRIMDYTGRSILTSSEDYSAGANTININKSDIGNAGVYLYELRYNDKVLGGKMIVID